MNMSILKMIKEYLKDTMKKAGFKVEGQRYVRVINEQLYQYIIFQGSSGGNQFTINVGIDTLLDKEIESGKCSFATMRLGMLLGQGDVWWTYTEESAMEVVGILSNFLLPKLDECSTYESMYKAMSKYINYLSDTARVKTTVMYNALWGSVGQISALCELLLCQNTTVGLRMTKEKIVSVKVACSRVVTLKTIANSYR